jgi:hypothetical protein
VIVGWYPTSTSASGPPDGYGSGNYEVPGLR